MLWSPKVVHGLAAVDSIKLSPFDISGKLGRICLDCLDRAGREVGGIGQHPRGGVHTGHGGGESQSGVQTGGKRTSAGTHVHL